MNPISRRRFLHGLAACGLLLSGCGRQPENENPAASDTASAASETAAEPQLLYRFGLPADPPPFRRIYAAGPPAEVLLHALAPERMAGWTAQKSPKALALFDEPSRRLPVLGGINGRGRPVSAEQLLQRKVDLIVDAGRVNAKLLSTAEETAKRLGIPYLLLDGRLAQAPAQIRLLGGILASPHTERLAALAQTALDFAAERAKSRRAAPPAVYLARGEDGLETGRNRSIHTETIAMLGARSMGDSLEGSGGLAKVPFEQILQWQPETILTQDDRFYRRVQADPLWRGVKAVQNRRVFLLPRLPYGWIDSPPGINRLPGLYALDAALSERPPADYRNQILPLVEALCHHRPTPAQLGELGLG